MDIFATEMHQGSFWTIWFWVMHAVIWAMASHFTLGVPYDMIQQANREPDEEGAWAEHCNALIRAQVFRFASYGRAFGVPLSGIAAFILAATLTIAIRAELELAWALFTFVGPLMVIYGLSIRAALAIERQDLQGRALRDAVRAQRFWNQFVGLVGVILAVSLAVWIAVRDLILMNGA